MQKLAVDFGSLVRAAEDVKVLFSFQHHSKDYIFLTQGVARLYDRSVDETSFRSFPWRWNPYTNSVYLPLLALEIISDREVEQRIQREYASYIARLAIGDSD